MIPTPHISLTDKSKVAKTVLMPGDPLRAKYIADNFLENVEKINEVRNMLGFTGTYNGKKITVFASGMGMPSIGIYSYELYNFYDVENIIRIGSAGAYSEKLKIYDIVLASEAWSESSYAKTQDPAFDKDIIQPSKSLNEKIEQSAKKLGIEYTLGRIHSSDVFYRKHFHEFEDIVAKTGSLCAEMESFALFHNANVSGKNAACLLTISDSLVTHQATTAEEREKSFTNMMKIALNVDCE